MEGLGILEGGEYGVEGLLLFGIILGRDRTTKKDLYFHL